MSETTFEAYRSARLAEGFDEVLERRWQADAVTGTHSHPFAVQAVVAVMTGGYRIVPFVP